MADLRSWPARGLGYQVDADGVAWLRLQRPEKRNAIDRPLREALLEAIHEVTEDPAVKVAVLHGEGTAFCSGADMTQEGGPIQVPPERRLDGPDGPRRRPALRLVAPAEAIWQGETRSSLR